MIDSIFGRWPWLGGRKTQAQTARTTSAEAEASSGGEEPTQWQVVATQLTPTEAIVIKARLESHQIPAIVKQEAIASVLALTTGPLGWADVLVPKEFVEQALEILAEVFDEDETEDEIEHDD
ncbi:DUF2007 domain-containing protein [Anaerolineales bacterium HSG6]|nr:DUF2007 domain-containing protein [Anaerolineales bacterium HSG6]